MLLSLIYPSGLDLTNVITDVSVTVYHCKISLETSVEKLLEKRLSSMINDFMNYDDFLSIYIRLKYKDICVKSIKGRRKSEVYFTVKVKKIFFQKYNKKINFTKFQNDKIKFNRQIKFNLDYNVKKLNEHFQ